MNKNSGNHKRLLNFKISAKILLEEVGSNNSAAVFFLVVKTNDAIVNSLKNLKFKTNWEKFTEKVNNKTLEISSMFWKT